MRKRDTEVTYSRVGFPPMTMHVLECQS